MIRVGFVLDLTPSGWLGGFNYYVNLISAINDQKNQVIAPVLFFGKKIDDSLLAQFRGAETVRTEALDRWSLIWVARKVIQRIFNRDFILERILVKNRIDVLSHYSGFGLQKKIRCIFWIPDFQHLHLPQYFSKLEIETRNSRWARSVLECDATIVSSHTALEDFKKFLPQNSKRKYVLQFAVASFWGEDDLNNIDIRNQYGISTRYFYVPNQFWAHKNHRVVIEAISILKEEGQSITIVSTGNTLDSRNLAYFPNLIKFAEKRNVLDNFKILGVVPFADIQFLMRNAVAVINPSSFEGWSTTVEEAKSINKKLLLSDIPVHREQNASRVRYFGIADPNQLAKLIIESLEEFDIDKELALMKQGSEPYNNARRKFGEDYQEIIKDIYKK